MKVVLFCTKPYSFSILRPLQIESEQAGDEIIWYIDSEIVNIFPFKNDSTITSSIQDIVDFKADIIFAPGNNVPYFLRGVKVQVFHGLAGEMQGHFRRGKKGHFRIRNYFDLYLTSGAFFTERFNKLSKKHGNFEVIETGWCKLDALFIQQNNFKEEKQDLLKKHKAQKILLFAPTFSPSLTSAEALFNEIITLSKNPDYLILVKFHDKMNKDVKTKYIQAAQPLDNLVIVDNPDISKYLILSDLMISDTSSVIYEFLFLDKPVITLKSSSGNIKWTDIEDSKELVSSVESVLKSDIHKENRQWIIDNYHPLSDGKSAKRMIEAVKNWLTKHPVPEKRKLSLLRKWKMSRKYGKIKNA
ncbi:CDP-glycerol glycerophosphotransferase family protein [Ancylomarina sp. 16SWW S1-10-2]|uniref:CDP-glycerol glycerophosphotransferase family protein n=1 Tax=Ancylomarina sp. 16SWW S1-10-2 TaxID=2499681 RepID=UPI0012ADDC67|nr:CDP-glycerol glycerophosphotransferase family protein [Ancylomarina sp. 16SWW S1-10-2]MRT94245.1 CDP-glycerol--glycerophosphate glycerophosphotransferase [Ancylomarina sp. 16SWW S1-10-2]